MIDAMSALLLLALGTPPKLPPELPKDAPETTMLARCVICHGVEYVTQQRLTPPQWEKTLLKMKGWGAPLTEEEVKTLAAFLAARFTPDAPESSYQRVATPMQALPPK